MSQDMKEDTELIKTNQKKGAYKKLYILWANEIYSKNEKMFKHTKINVICHINRINRIIWYLNWCRKKHLIKLNTLWW